MVGVGGRVRKWLTNYPLSLLSVPESLILWTTPTSLVSCGCCFQGIPFLCNEYRQTVQTSRNGCQLSSEVQTPEQPRAWYLPHTLTDDIRMTSFELFSAEELS